MNRVNFNHKISLITLGLMLISQSVSSQTLPTCPKSSDLQIINLTVNDLKENSPPHQDCCTASGFPYFVEGTWSIDKKFVTSGSVQWDISSRAETGRTPEQALIKLKKLFTHLPKPWLHNEYGHWVCEYGDEGVDAWLVW